MTQTRKKASQVSSIKTRESENVINSNVLEAKLGFRIRMADRTIYKRFVKAVGMTPVQYSMLTLVAENEGMSQGVIGEALNLDRASTMAIMDKLVISGWVERRRSPVDRRRYAMYLTVSGRRKVASTEKKVAQVDGYFKDQLSDKQLRELIRCLDIIQGSY